MSTLDLTGDMTDFSSNPRGQSPRPNDFFSFFVDNEEEEWIITGDIDNVRQIRPYVRKHISTLPAMGNSITVVVMLKLGVNIRDVRDIVAQENAHGRPSGSVGRNRSAYLA